MKRRQKEHVSRRSEVECITYGKNTMQEAFAAFITDAPSRALSEEHHEQNALSLYINRMGSNH